MTAARRRVLGAFAALALILAGAPACAQAVSGSRAERGGGGEAIADRIASAVRDAAALTGLPQAWIEAVMAVESGGRPDAVSRAGAMGLMQLMPRTWRELRARLGLGPDPFEVRDNVLAGAAYLREMHDRFGAPGFLAAYNAGPARYAEHLAFGRPLPAETHAYLARLTPRLGGASAGPPAIAAAPAGWRGAPLFPAPAHGERPAGGLFAAPHEAPQP